MNPDADERLRAAESLLASDDPAEVADAEQRLLELMASDARARPLAAAAFDRLRMLRGEPQKFGTQIIDREGHRRLWPVDPATTDSERTKWGLPPLAELRRALADD